MSNRVLYDGAAGVGNHATPFQVGQQIKWTDEESRGVLYKRRYRVIADYFTPLALSSTGPEGGWLVEETQPSPLEAGLVEWERLWAFLPPTRVRGESVVFNVQQQSGSDILEVPLTTSALVTYDYFHRLDPSTIPILRATRLIKTGTRIYRIGPVQNPASPTVLVEDSRLRPWRGHIYERATSRVTLASFTGI